MINSIRIDYSGPSNNINQFKLKEFVAELQDLLTKIAAEINLQKGTLVVKVYDGQHFAYSFENISRETADKIRRLARQI